MPRIDELKDNLSEIQGNVIRGYRPSFAAYLFFHIHDPAKGKAWLQAILSKVKITYSQHWGTGTRPPFTVNIAFSHSGLEALGLPPHVLTSFPEEFQQGMLPRAVDTLGDEPGTDMKTPKHWDLGFKTKTKKIHALVVITARTKAKWDNGIKKLINLMKDGGFHPKVELLKDLSIYGNGLPEQKEHFGFADGISQPFMEGTDALFKDLLSKRPPFPGQGTPIIKSTWPPLKESEYIDGEAARWKHLKPGEFILGYEDEFGEVALSPMHYDLRKNGTYLVFRKLEQNVKGFQDFLKNTSKKIWNKTTAESENLLAAKLMGRWKSGCPLERDAEKDNPNFDYQQSKKNNDFLYNNKDKDGLKCPLGAHIRRTNPRDQLLKLEKSWMQPDKNLYHLNRHRIIRRGLPYGERYVPGSVKKRGLVFVALNASISRQFEFLQEAWVNNGEFLGLDKRERDPVIGKKHDQKTKFTVPGADFPHVTSLQRFVTERGGEYFFYPGRTALQKLVTGEFQKPPSFLSEWEAFGSISNPTKQAAARQILVREWLIWRAQEMFDELRENEDHVFQVPGIPHPLPGKPLVKPPMVIATKYVDVKTILEDKKKTFSVALYTKKMVHPRGPFVLGMEHYDTRPQTNYAQELGIIKKAVYPPDGDVKNVSQVVGKTIYDIIERLAGDIMKKKKKDGKIDVIEDLVWPVTLRLNWEYFGVPGPGPGSELDTFKRWSRDIYTDLFLNLREDVEWTRRADIAVKEMNAYLDDLIQSTRKELKNCLNVPETVLTRMIKMQEGSGDKFHDGWKGIRRNIFGMVIGVVETTMKAVPRTIHQFLREDRKNELAKAQEAALHYTYEQDPKHFKKYVFEAMRFNPQNHVVFRLAFKDFKLGEGEPWETETIKATKEKPVLVFAATLGAMFDPDKIKPDPTKFHIHRGEDQYLFFGHEHHKCLGEYISRIQVPILVKQVLAQKGLKEAKETQFHPRNLLPEHYFLEFKAQGVSPQA